MPQEGHRSRLLKYVATEPVDYVIVHKVDRLARNRADDVAITLAIRQAGAQLVSCTENIDETPSGALLHGIMSSIAEFYSRNLANEVIKGLKQKAKTGGTPGRVPPGYFNVINREAGRELRTVEVDSERAPLVRWAFETYATGEHTLVQLTDELEAMGLTSLPTAKRASAPLSRSTINRMLRNPYYMGYVTYQGVRYEGSHEPLVSKATWFMVQAVLDAHNAG
jgi:DNA invertase Pin-like site-specific DNA recombinase